MNDEHANDYAENYVVLEVAPSHVEPRNELSYYPHHQNDSNNHYWQQTGHESLEVVRGIGWLNHSKIHDEAVKWEEHLCRFSDRLDSVEEELQLFGECKVEACSRGYDLDVVGQDSHKDTLRRIFLGSHIDPNDNDEEEGNNSEQANES